MRYSVYNVARGDYDYYEDAVPAATLNAPKPPHLVNRTLGSTVEQAAWALPPAARPIGSGSLAVGRVAVQKSGVALGAFVPSSPLVKAGLLAFVGVLLYKYVMPGRSR